MPPTFRSPRTYHPSYSLLGRAVRAWATDRLRGEALFIVSFSGLCLGVLLAHYLGWALLEPLLAAHPSWQTVFWGGQLVSVLGLVAVGLVGSRPEVRVDCRRTAVVFQQGARHCHVPYADVQGVERIAARRYHRHHRRYAATRVFVSVLPEEVLLVRTEAGPIVVALPAPAAQTTLQEHLARAAAPTRPAPEAASSEAASSEAAS